jgi:putative acetyltransferase
VFVAEEGGRILGYGRFDADTGEVEATYVLPETQGRGVGSALLAESEARARQAGFDTIYVSASLNAVAFYRRAGFEPQVQRLYELPGGRHLACMYMTRRLGR